MKSSDTTQVDIAIAGSGFGGSILAMVARRLGLSVFLIEKWRHPRFVIGESTTPFTNLLLEQIATEFDLPRLIPFCEWGKWQRTYPQVSAGLKRGFTFYHHEFGHEFVPRADRSNHLMVAASPRDELGDTHWYRPEFDFFLVEEARAVGVDYRDETVIREIHETSRGVEVEIERRGICENFKARLLIDATGPRSALDSLLVKDEMLATHSQFPDTEGLYTHFTGVRRFSDLYPPAGSEVPPYSPDDAALHHVFDGGWIWVLRFNNGITSAGVAAKRELADELQFHEGNAAWDRLLARLPAVAKQFESAVATLPFVHARQLSFKRNRVAGSRWLRMPSSAGFVDPLLSTGFPLTLLGIKRIAKLLGELNDGEVTERSMLDYAAQTSADLEWTFQITGALYSKLNQFDSFVGLSLLYFAAASFTETAHRLGRASLCGDGFLLRNNSKFRQSAQECFALARADNSTDTKSLRQKCATALSEFDVAGLSELNQRNWYPVRSEDLRNGAPKLGVTAAEMEDFLVRFGMA